MADQRSGWTRIQLDEAVEVVTEYWDRDEKTPERFVAGEHIDEGDLRIRRWGMTSDELVPPTFNRRFRAGDVLFHSRNLRKLARPDFSGITGEKLFVLRSRNDAHLLPDLLPFLLETREFGEYVNTMWAGSTNKFLNKGPLVKFEFALPPIEEQRRISRVLLRTEELVETLRYARERAEEVHAAIVGAAILSANPSGTASGWTMQLAGDLCAAPITKGATPQGELAADDTGVPFLKVYNLTFTGQLDFSISPTFITPKGHHELRRSIVRPGDILMNIVGPPLGKVSRVPSHFPEANINQAIARFRPATEQIGDWLTTYLLSPAAQSWLHARSKKTSGQRNLTLETCRELPVPIPPLGTIESLLSRTRLVADTASVLLSRGTRASAFRQELLNHALRPGRV
jgi:hypothetical protein